MSELAQAIEEMRNMRESYDQLAGAAEAYNEGKPALAEAITAKGAEASATDSLATMAEKVMTISQNTYEINGGEMYAKQLFGSLETPNYWNLYDILAQLLSDGRLVNYGGILLAEYYKGYDSLALSGAGAGGAYVVSDMENGQFKMYTEDTTHTWNDNNNGRTNRWVAYCFVDAEHDFEITSTNTSPRSIYIGRHVGAIKNLTNGRVSEIIVPDGNKLNTIDAGTYTNQWNKKVIIRNLQNLNSTVLYHATSVESVHIHAKSASARGILVSTSNALALTTAVFDFDVSNGCILFDNTSSDSFFNSVSYIAIKSTGYIHFRKYNDSPKMANVRTIVVFSDSINIVGQSKNKFNAATKIYLNYITNDKTKSVVLSNKNPEASSTHEFSNIQDVVIKDGWCKPLNVSVLVSLTEENIYAHILQRLKQDEPDCGDGVTITLGSTNLAKLTSEESVQLLDDLTNIYGYTFA